MYRDKFSSTSLANELCYYDNGFSHNVRSEFIRKHVMESTFSISPLCHFCYFLASYLLPLFLPFVIVQQVRKSCNQNEFSAGKKSGSSEHGNLSFCRTCSHLNCLPFFPFRTCRLPKISDLFPQKRLFLSCVMHRDDR